MSKREVIIILTGLIFFVGLLCLFLFVPPESVSASADGEAVSTEASSQDEREAFLSQFGWEVEPEPLAVKEVMIPHKFNDVYLKYNELQLTQGFDLSKLCGKKVKLWTYRVKNYPSVDCDVVANLLVRDGKVVGGDISSAELDGFMHGFDPTAAGDETAQVQQSSATIDRSVPDVIPADSDALPEPDGDDE